MQGKPSEYNSFIGSSLNHAINISVVLGSWFSEIVMLNDEHYVIVG